MTVSSLSRWERVGGRGYGLSLGLNPSPGATRRPLPTGEVKQDLPHQFLHRAFKTLDRDRIHAVREQPADDGGGFRIVPVPLRHRVEPDRVRIGAGDALE